MCCRICGCELGGYVGEVGEGELARVGGVAYAKKADFVLDDVAVLFSASVNSCML